MKCQLSDRDLFSEVKNGCKKSFQTIYQRYFDYLNRYSLSLISDAELSQDLIQELFVQLWEKKDGLEISNIKGYLTTSLRHRIINAYRDNKYVDLDEEIIFGPCLPDRVDKKIKEDDLEQEFNSILNRLPKKCRNVFYLSRIKKYRNREIAEELDISIRTVETHISNALQYFKAF